MIIVTMNNLEKFELRWNSGAWRDKAGHIWTMQKDGVFASLHGTAKLYQWRIPDEKRFGNDN